MSRAQATSDGLAAEIHIGLSPVPSGCVPARVSALRYQEAAAEVLAADSRNPGAWSWITTTCGVACLRVEHLRVHAPIRFAYPYGVCIYCGGRAWTKDHLLPRNWTGDAQRHFVVTVPACAVCNGLLGDTLTSSITERRTLCQARMRKRYRKVLRTVEFGESDLAKMGPTLRQYVRDQMAHKAEVLRMLAWPDDPGFDMRALQRSGIDDPFVAGMILADDDPKMWEYIRSVV